MPNSLVLVSGVELALVLLTTILLTQPALFFRKSTQKSKSTARWVGLVFLVVTFCWSVVLGIVVSMSQMTLRL